MSELANSDLNKNSVGSHWFKALNKFNRTSATGDLSVDPLMCKIKSATSTEELYTAIKQMLSGPDLEKYFLMQGKFLSNFLEYVTPTDEEQQYINDIIAIPVFKDLAFKLLPIFKDNSSIYSDLIKINGLWKDDPKVESVLIKLSYSKDQTVRIAAAHALRKSTSKIAIKRLAEIMQNREDYRRLFSLEE